jgi:Ca2+-binding RTX toxin-like protein
VARQSRSALDFRTKALDNLSGSGLQPALGWAGITPNDYIQVGPDGAVQTLSGVEELFFQQTGEVRFLKGAEPDQPVVDGPDPVPTAPAPYIEPPAEPEPPAGGGGDTTVPDPLPGNGGTFVANPTGGELVGTNGNDVLLGSFLDDFVYGFGGDDFVNLARGSDSFYGGDGQDTALIPGALSDYNLSVGGAGQLIFLPVNIADIFTNTKLLFDTEIISFEGSGQSFTYAELAGTAISTNSMLGVLTDTGGHTHHDGCGHVHDYSLINERLGIDTSVNELLEPHNNGCACVGCGGFQADSTETECMPVTVDRTSCDGMLDDAYLTDFA